LIVYFRVFEVNVRTGELRKQGIRIKLQDQPFQVLAMLLEKLNELVTREELQKRLNALAKKTGRTKTFYAREAILKHLDDMEDYYLAVDRLKHPRRRWTKKEVEKQIGLGD
jgi:RHH-type rel operon transcriptional repressor/antitoxin RelB